MLLIAWFGFATLLCWAVVQRVTDRQLTREVEIPQTGLMDSLDLQ